MGTDRLTRSHARPRAGRGSVVALGAVVGALLVPGAAQAAMLTVQGTCFASGQPVVVAGTAFTPGGAVAIGGAVTGAAQADGLGAFTTQVLAPSVKALGPRPKAITAIDQANPGNTTTVRIQVVRSAFASNLPVAGRPRRRVRWRFAGFLAGQPIYGHFLRDGVVQSDYRFGVAVGDCGTLAVRASRIPGVRRIRAGHWTLRLDQRMTYDPATPGSDASFEIVQRDPGERARGERTTAVAPDVGSLTRP